MPTLGYQVRPYQDGDEEGILRLFHDVFGDGDGRIPVRTEEQWRWEYLGNPAGTQVSIAVTDAGRIVAHYACLPARMQLYDRIGLAGQGVDSMVHRDYRRGLKKEGPFLAAARHYFATWGNSSVCALGFGYPNDQAFRIGVKVLGYRPVRERLPALYRNFFQHGDDDEVGRRHVGALEARPIARFGAEHDWLWQSLAPHFPCALVRDSRYLDWRYLRCPHVRYFCYDLRAGGELRGWFVLRSNWTGVPILAVVDLFVHPQDEAAVAVALRHAVAQARAQQQARVELWLPEEHPLFGHALRAGFEQERCNYSLCAMLYWPDLDLERIRQDWYFTIGDSDLF